MAPDTPERRMRERSAVTGLGAFAVALAAFGGVTFAGAKEAHAQCVDEELKQELVGGRHYRGVQERLFTKAFRHELSVMGGYYGADLYSSNWIVSGAYTFHFSED